MGLLSGGYVAQRVNVLQPILKPFRTFHLVWIDLLGTFPGQAFVKSSYVLQVKTYHWISGHLCPNTLPVSSLSWPETYRITAWEISQVTARQMIRKQWSAECLEAHLTWHLPPPPHSLSRSEVNFWSSSDDPARLPWEPLKEGDTRNAEIRHFGNWFWAGYLTYPLIINLGSNSFNRPFDRPLKCS